MVQKRVCKKDSNLTQILSIQGVASDNGLAVTSWRDYAVFTAGIVQHTASCTDNSKQDLVETQRDERETQVKELKTKSEWPESNQRPIDFREYSHTVFNTTVNRSTN